LLTVSKFKFKIRCATNGIYMFGERRREKGRGQDYQKVKEWGLTDMGSHTLTIALADRIRMHGLMRQLQAKIVTCAL
jgi:hypothetical protein